jgi:hypothetical protein
MKCADVSRGRPYLYRLLRTLLSVTACTFAALAAGEQTFYKSVLPNGRIVYGDEPAAGAKRTEKITVQTDMPGSPVDAEAAQRALEMNRQQLLRDAAARSARLTQLEAEIAAAYDELKAAEEARDSGRAVQEGDRQGRRMLGTYGERQRRLEAAARQARQKLDRLLAERSALR